MREDRILLGGEVSGHIFFGENYYGVDDGILASCKIIELAARSREPLSALFDSLPHLHATSELKAMCPDAPLLLRALLARAFTVEEIAPVRGKLSRRFPALFAHNLAFRCRRADQA
jgi:phosphomannomutase